MHVFGCFFLCFLTPGKDDYLVCPDRKLQLSTILRIQFLFVSFFLSFDQAADALPDSDKISTRNHISRMIYVLNRNHPTSPKLPILCRALAVPLSVECFQNWVGSQHSSAARLILYSHAALSFPMPTDEAVNYDSGKSI